jgi:hypothetical protein
MEKRSKAGAVSRVSAAAKGVTLNVGANPTDFFGRDERRGSAS